jgi:hypothetical protein
VRCSRTKPPPEGYGHDEHVVARDRVDGGVTYRCKCRCGEEFTIGVLVADGIADALVAHPEDRSTP